MIVDPRSHANRHMQGPERPPLVVIMALAAEVGVLADLADWMPCGVLLEALPASLRGGDGLTRRDIRRLRVWAANWRSLHPDVRAFYATNHDQPGVEAGLWYLLGSRRDKPLGPVIGRIRRAYTDAYGHEPAIELLPTPATQEDPP